MEKSFHLNAKNAIISTMLNNQEQFKSPEEEIASLRQRIEELKIKSPERMNEAAIEAVKEHVKKTKEEPPSQPTSHISSAEEKEYAAKIFDLQPEEHDDKILKLLRLSKEKGILYAIKLIQKTENEHLLDDFERALARELAENAANEQ